VAVDGGGVFVQTVGGPEADRLGIVVGRRVSIRHLPGSPSDAMLESPAPSAGRSVPLIAGVVIAVLGVTASFIV
jgi:hypothetical protein